MAGAFNSSEAFDRGDRQTERAPESRFESADFQIGNPKATYAQLAADSGSYANQGVIGPCEVSNGSIYASAWKSSTDGSATIEQAQRQNQAPDESWGWVRGDGSNTERAGNGRPDGNAAETDRTLIAQVSDSQRDTSKMQSGDLPTGSRIADHAKALGERHPDWWKNEGPHGEIRKCNLFADRVYRDTKVPLPWDGGHIPTVHGMVGQLSKSPDWEAVYTDKKAISDYKPQAGDFALWDKNMNFANYGGTTTHLHLEHSGVIGKEGEIMYAGSSATHGYAESDLKAMSAAATFGPPSVIFRSKHLSQ